jgi:mono/diheme cytochrome c family protein
MSIKAKATILGFTACVCLLGVTLGLSNRERSANPHPISANPAMEAEAARGRSLFELNCAHCHGDDARGDEGPSLYQLTKSDARITKIINGGIKGEMPKFGTKFNEADVHDIIAYLHTLKSIP